MRIVIIALLSCLFFSCKYNQEDPFPSPVTGDGSGSSITYTNFAKSVIDNNCVICHAPNITSPQSPYLTTYNELKQQADNGRIQARCIDGPSFMPPSGKMSQPIIDTLQLWINQGALQ